MSDDQPDEQGATTGEPLLPTWIPCQDDNPFSAYRSCGEIRNLPPEERSHWDSRMWVRR